MEALKSRGNIKHLLAISIFTLMNFMDIIITEYESREQKSVLAFSKIIKTLFISEWLFRLLLSWRSSSMNHNFSWPSVFLWPSCWFVIRAKLNFRVPENIWLHMSMQLSLPFLYLIHVWVPFKISSQMMFFKTKTNSRPLKFSCAFNLT